MRPESTLTSAETKRASPSSIRIPADLTARIEAIAERHRRRKSQVARETLEWYLDFWEQAQQVGDRIVQQTLNAMALDAGELRVRGHQKAKDACSPVVDLNLWRQSHPRPIKRCVVEVDS